KGNRSNQHKPKVILLPATKPLPAPEIEGPLSAAVIWLNRPLVDPTPPALRLSPKFARNLKAAAKSAGVDWALLLGVIRAKGLDGIAKGKVDVRVLATIAYLRQTFGQVTVSSLISGHRLYARPGVVSAHVYGHAVDISGLENTPILGHQEPGGITERAVHDILLLPGEV